MHTWHTESRIQSLWAMLPLKILNLFLTVLIFRILQKAWHQGSAYESEGPIVSAKIQWIKVVPRSEQGDKQKAEHEGMIWPNWDGADCTFPWWRKGNLLCWLHKIPGSLGYYLGTSSLSRLSELWPHLRGQGWTPPSTFGHCQICPLLLALPFYHFLMCPKYTCSSVQPKQQCLGMHDLLLKFPLSNNSHEIQWQWT